ncbi:MAG: hypothetical protein HZY76_21295 [Anaerolineae bacterium]|nr:MAG: hypothetical protein HZY76_21295 [Anaerolineae bacterium]
MAQQRQWWAATVLAVQVLLLAILAVARLGLLVPISGHVFLLVFFVLWTAGQAPIRCGRPNGGWPGLHC